MSGFTVNFNPGTLQASDPSGPEISGGTLTNRPRAYRVLGDFQGAGGGWLVRARFGKLSAQIQPGVFSALPTSKDLGPKAAIVAGGPGSQYFYGIGLSVWHPWKLCEAESVFPANAPQFQVYRGGTLDIEWLIRHPSGNGHIRGASSIGTGSGDENDQSALLYLGYWPERSVAVSGGIAGAFEPYQIPGTSPVVNINFQTSMPIRVNEDPAVFAVTGITLTGEWS